MHMHPLTKALLGFCLIAALGFSGTVAAAETKTCDVFVKTAADLNGHEVFNAVTVCAAAGQKEDTNFLMLLGQIKSMTDMTIYKPANEDEAEKVTDLYGKIYYPFSGLGFDEVYREPKKVEHIISRIESINLKFNNDYNPGWDYKLSSPTDVFNDVLAVTKLQRIWQMQNFALRVQNDTYFEAYLQEQALRAENPIYEQDTPVYKEYQRLTKIMRDASSEIEQLPKPKGDISRAVYRRLNAPDPDAEFVQVGSGFNGPEKYSTDIFRSEKDVRESWLATVYTAPELDEIITKVNFNERYLFSYNFGERMNASGSVYVRNLKHDKKYDGYSFNTRIGIIPEDCGIKFEPSFPFVLATIAAVDGAEINSSGMSNFPDDCGPIKSGTAATAKKN
jgi:hypothetical protein